MEQVIKAVPVSHQRKARLLYRLLKHHPSEISWSSRGEVTIEGVFHSGSNITDLISDVLRARKNFKPAHHEEFAVALARVNVPQELVSNPERWRLVHLASRATRLLRQTPTKSAPSDFQHAHMHTYNIQYAHFRLNTGCPCLYFQKRHSFARVIQCPIVNHIGDGESGGEYTQSYIVFGVGDKCWRKSTQSGSAPGVDEMWWGDNGSQSRGAHRCWWDVVGVNFTPCKACCGREWRGNALCKRE